MLVKIWRFVTILCVALTMGLLFAHVLELPPKMTYDGSLYVTIQNSLYQWWGGYGPGGVVDALAVLGTIGLVFLVRKRRLTFWLTLAAAICLFLSLPVVFFTFTEPANVVFRAATPQSLPSNWEQWRLQWEFSHATSFVLYLSGFCLLLLSLIMEKPAKQV